MHLMIFIKDSAEIGHVFNRIGIEFTCPGSAGRGKLAMLLETYASIFPRTLAAIIQHTAMPDRYRMVRKGCRPRR